MEDKLLKYFQRIMPLSREEVEAIVETMTIKQYKKGTVLLEEGQISTEAYFVLEGCVRQFYLVDGEEKTVISLQTSNGSFLLIVLENKNPPVIIWIVVLTVHWL